MRGVGFGPPPFSFVAVPGWRARRADRVLRMPVVICTYDLIAVRGGVGCSAYSAKP
jgi:hypothetical protein